MIRKLRTHCRHLCAGFVQLGGSEQRFRYPTKLKKCQTLKLKDVRVYHVSAISYLLVVCAD